MYLRAYIAVAEAHAGDGEWEGGNDGGGEAVRGCPIHGLVSSPAHQLGELGTQAYTDRLLTKFRLFVDGINHFIKIIFEYTFKNWIIAKKNFNEALYNSNFKVQSLVSSPAHQLRELGAEAYAEI